MTLYLSTTQVLELHARLLSRFGGAAGVRDRAALEAALARPQATFDGDDLYDDLAAKAGALLHSLIANHPFVDGNKRVGAMTAELFLTVNGYRLVAGDGELEGFIFAVARGEHAALELAIWIGQRLQPLEQ